MEFVKYHKKYTINKEVYDSINEYLKPCSIKNMIDLLDFCKEGEVEKFIKVISNKLEKDKNMLKKLEKASECLSSSKTSDYRALLLLSTALQNVDVLNTIKYHNSNDAKKFFNKFDKISFYLTKTKYNDHICGHKTIGDYGEYYGPKSDRKTQFVMPTETAQEIDNVLKNKTKEFKEKAEYFESTIGYPTGYLEKCNLLFRIDLDGKNIKEDSEKFSKCLADLKEMGIYLPNGVEQGANDLFIAGGLTDGGIPESVINSVPNTPRYVKKVTQYDFSKKENIEIQEYAHKYYEQPKIALKPNTIQTLAKSAKAQA